MFLPVHGKMIEIQGRNQVDVSIVVPVFNEGGNISPLYYSTEKVMDRIHKVYEIIFIDDGITDDSFDL